MNHSQKIKVKIRQKIGEKVTTKDNPYLKITFTDKRQTVLIFFSGGGGGIQ